MAKQHPGSHRPRITVAAIVRHTPAALDTTLESVRDIADETLVVDAGSTAGAAEIAGRHGATIFEFPGTDDFSAARNHLWDRATGDWILWLEAGERLAPSGVEALRQFVDTSADPSAAYMLLVIAEPAPGQISSEQAGQIRLAPNHPLLRFQGRGRERLDESCAAANLTIEALPWRILRASAGNAQTQAAEARRELRLVEMELAEQGRLPHLLVARGESLARLGDAGAMESFAEACHAGERGSTAQREAFYGLMTALGDDSASRDSLTKICLEALGVFPLDAQLLSAVGGYMQSQGRLDLAETAYRTAYEHGQIDPRTWHVSDIHEIAAICLSLALQMQSRDADARQALEHALTRFPRSTRIRRHLIELCVKHDDRHRALEEVDRLPGDASQRESLRAAVRGGCLAAKTEWNEAIRFLQAAYEDGCRDILCMRWLTSSLVAAGRRNEAAEIVREWQALEPRSEALSAYRTALGVTEMFAPGETPAPAAFLPTGARSAAGIAGP